jgi:hypothetical protein
MHFVEPSRIQHLVDFDLKNILGEQPYIVKDSRILPANEINDIRNKVYKFNRILGKRLGQSIKIGSECKAKLEGCLNIKDSKEKKFYW